MGCSEWIQDLVKDGTGKVPDILILCGYSEAEWGVSEGSSISSGIKHDLCYIHTPRDCEWDQERDQDQWVLIYYAEIFTLI